LKAFNRQSGIGNLKPHITASILRWYRKFGRDLPWRDERDPYRIVVSEVMLQQTQVSRVFLKYPPFVKRFPTFEKLALARTSDVIRAWQGMGYNNRVLRLQHLARAVAHRFEGKLPRDIAELQKLPGIGRYTAHAISCFAFGNQVPVVDTNVARLLSRLFPDKIGPVFHERKSSGKVWQVAEWILPKRRAHEWNQALMDLGATICTARAPKCGICPLRNQCPSAHYIREEIASTTTREPARGGIPNRIFRGRVVEVLRNLNGRKSIPVKILARKVKTDYSRTDERWFAGILRNLERDGLVKLRTSASTLRASLPDE
jgi:A/G-specific adenine glycosylase